MKSNTQLRIESIKRVFNKIRNEGPVSKRELQEITGFSWGNISSITSQLLNDGYILPSGKVETFVGRKPEAFDVNQNDNFIIGIDFSTKGVLGVVCDLKGRMIFKTELRFTEREKEAALNILYSAIEQLLNKVKSKKILYVAIAMQGEVDSENGVSVTLKKIKNWNNVPMCSLIKEKFGIDSVMFHDPDCVLHTEKYYGALSGCHVGNAILLSLTNHGVGMAALIDGKIYKGQSGKTCEIGNMLMPVYENTTPEFFQNIFTADWLIKNSGYTNSEITLNQIVLNARNGLQKEKRAFEKLGDILGVALNNASWFFNPEQIILFGSFCKFSDLFLDNANKKIQELMSEDAPKIVVSEFDDTAAAIGAAIFAADAFIEKSEF